MKEVNNLPIGIEVYSGIMSSDEAELIIDQIESAVNSNNKCDVHWGTPTLHSPDVTCLRRGEAINLSEHSFQNANCNCGIREIEIKLGKIMIKCLEKYSDKYSVGITQDEGFIIVRQTDEHISEYGVDDNPFVNRLLSLHFPLNLIPGSKYIEFKNLDYSLSLSYPSIIIFPSNFLFSYSKEKQDGLYEIQNFFNNNPSQEYFEKVFSEKSD